MSNVDFIFLCHSINLLRKRCASSFWNSVVQYDWTKIQGWLKLQKLLENYKISQMNNIEWLSCNMQPSKNCLCL